MTFDWQSAVVLLVIAGSAVYLARTAWQTMSQRKTAACGGCGTCSAGAKHEEPAVVSLGSALKSDL